MSKVKIAALAVVVVSLGYLLWTWDLDAPRIDWRDTPTVVGKTGRISIHVSDEGKGLREVEVAALQDGKRQVLLSERYAGSGWPWQDRTRRRSVALALDTADMPEIREGEFDLEVRVSDQPNLLLFSRSLTDAFKIRLDTTPPTLQVLTPNHFVRQGGAESIVYRVGEPAAESGVRVGEDVFVGFPLPERGPDAYVCLFGMAWNQPIEAEMFLFATDEAGNRSETAFRKEIIPVRFRKRSIQVSDAFIEKVAKDILPNTDQVTRGDTPVETYVAINSRLREINHRRIAEIAKMSAPRLLWKEPFLQLAGSQVEASFADQRDYYHQGKLIDQQTHQGFDLASTARTPVECANDGVVLWAGYLGIYGNCVLVDHGLGLISLYGHLSSIEVAAGQQVRRRQSLGRTGETGLAGGDHLHFSMVLQGVQTNPLEWWDAQWVQRHILSRVGPAPEPPAGQ